MAGVLMRPNSRIVLFLKEFIARPGSISVYFSCRRKDDEDLGEATVLGKDGFTYAHRLGDLALVALDLRSERTQNQVMSPETWDRLQTWLEEELKEKLLPDNSKQAGCKHLLVMSGIPIVNADLTLLETVLDLRPGQQRMEDDLKDQWLSRAHQQERLRLIHRCYSFRRKPAAALPLFPAMRTWLLWVIFNRTGH